MPRFAFLVAVALFCFVFVYSKDSADVVMEFAKFHLLEDDFVINGRAIQETTHKLIFAIKQNTDSLDSILDDVSNPRSLNYGRHLTRDQVSQLDNSLSCPHIELPMKIYTNHGKTSGFLQIKANFRLTVVVLI
jgi:Pro-kumamolisin, activation domain